MARMTVTVRVRVAWWFEWYALGVVLMARLMQTEPDPDKVTGWARRAIKVQVEQTDG